jgi:type IV pilus assembly protein PilA
MPCAGGEDQESSPLVPKEILETKVMRAPIRDQNRARRKAQNGFSLIELLIVVAIILIIAAIAIPNLLRSRQSANQASAVANLRTISTASVSYWVTYSNGYPPSLASLGGPVGAPATCNQAILVDEVLTTAPYRKSGYQYNFVGQQGNVALPPAGCTPGFVGYLTTATPITMGVTGNISYCSYEPGIIHYDTSGATAPDEATCGTLPNL